MTTSGGSSSRNREYNAKKITQGPGDAISGLALTNHSRYSGLKQCKSMFSLLWRSGSEIRVPTCPLRALGDNCSLSSQVLVTASILCSCYYPVGLELLVYFLCPRPSLVFLMHPYPSLRLTKKTS